MRLKTKQPINIKWVVILLFFPISIISQDNKNQAQRAARAATRTRRRTPYGVYVLRTMHMVRGGRPPAASAAAAVVAVATTAAANASLRTVLAECIDSFILFSFLFIVLM